MTAIAASSPKVNRPVVRRQLLPSPVLGTLMFVLSEMMFFGALISAFLIVKSGNIMWPPPGQPRLPVEFTAINTLFLVASGIMVFLSNKSLAAGNGTKSRNQLAAAIVLGAVFVAVQGFEWVRLLGFGLSMTSSTYGSFFFMIIGCHALHVVGALIVLISVYVKFCQGRLEKASFWGIQVFWYFVVGVWPVLYVLVYLS